MLTATSILDQSKVQIENHPKFYMLKGPKGRELEKQVLNSYPLQESLRSPLLICGPTKIPWTPKFCDSNTGAVVLDFTEPVFQALPSKVAVCCFKQVFRPTLEFVRKAVARSTTSTQITTV